MTRTARLDLPLIAPEQAQKHVTHNEALLGLDALVQPVLLGVGASVPPVAPALGDAYGLGESPEGAWEGEGGTLAVWTHGGWRFFAPGEGWTAFDLASGAERRFSGGHWRDVRQELALLGVGTQADAVNRLAVRGEAALFAGVPEGEGGNGNVRLTLNREDAAGSATVIFQSGWSGRAEIGIAGEEALSFKVSADGAQFTTAMSLSPAEGFVTFHRFFGAEPSFPAVVTRVVTAQTGHIVPQSAANTQVDTVEGGFDGALLVVSGTAGRTLTFRSGVGNLRLPGNRVLDNVQDTLTLVRRGGEWLEVSYANNT